MLRRRAEARSWRHHTTVGFFVTQHLARGSEHAVLTEDPAQVSDLLSLVRESLPQVLGIAIRNARGRVLARSGEVVSESPPSRSPHVEMSARDVNGREVLVFRAPIGTSTETSPSAAAVEVVFAPHPAEDLEAWKHRARYLARRLARDVEYSISTRQKDHLEPLIGEITQSWPDVLGIAIQSADASFVHSHGLPLATVLETVPMDTPTLSTVEGREAIVVRAPVLATADPKRAPEPIGEVRLAVAR